MPGPPGPIPDISTHYQQLAQVYGGQDKGPINSGYPPEPFHTMQAQVGPVGLRGPPGPPGPSGPQGFQVWFQFQFTF